MRLRGEQVSAVALEVRRVEAEALEEEVKVSP
jgi:hypothetical protein